MRNRWEHFCGIGEAFFFGSRRTAQSIGSLQRVQCNPSNHFGSGETLSRDKRSRELFGQAKAMFVLVFHLTFQLKSEKLKQIVCFSAQFLKSWIFIYTAKNQKLE